jgi:hypothetical protein
MTWGQLARRYIPQPVLTSTARYPATHNPSSSTRRFVFVPRTVTVGSDLTWCLSALLQCFDDVCVDTNTKPIPDAGRRQGEQNEELLCVPFRNTVTSSLLHQRVYLRPVLPSAPSPPPLHTPLYVSRPCVLPQSPTRCVWFFHPSVLTTALCVIEATEWVGKEVKRKGTRVRLPPGVLRRLSASSYDESKTN